MNRRGFAAVEIIMVLITLVAIVAGVAFVLGSEDTSSTDTTEEDQDMSTTLHDTENEGEGRGDLNIAESDNKRRANLATVQADLEAYYDRNQNYPKQSDFLNEVWRLGNLYQDPMNETAYVEYPIVYSVRPVTCDNGKLKCASYDVSADLEFDGISAQDRDGDTADAVVQSQN